MDHPLSRNAIVDEATSTYGVEYNGTKIASHTCHHVAAVARTLTLSAVESLLMQCYTLKDYKAAHKAIFAEYTRQDF